MTLAAMSSSLDDTVEARLTANSSTTKGGKLFNGAGTAYALGAGELCRKEPAIRQKGMALAGSAKRSIGTPICCHRRGKGSDLSLREGGPLAGTRAAMARYQQDFRIDYVT